jgi:hypothetical protein
MSQKREREREQKREKTQREREKERERERERKRERERVDVFRTIGHCLSEPPSPNWSVSNVKDHLSMKSTH